MDKVNFDNIEEVKEYAMSLSEEDYKLFIHELIHDLMNTADNNYRNTIAIILGDLHCNETIEPLMELVNDSKTESCRGTLIYALENFDIADRLDDFIKLLTIGNYEVKCNIDTLFEKQSTYMSDSQKIKYVDMIKKSVSNLESSIELMYDLCANVFNESLD